MKSAIIAIGLVGSAIFASAAPQGASSPAPTCTSTAIFNPGGNGAPNCTFAGATKTKTIASDCSGCALTTQTLRVPIPCKTVSTNKASTKTITQTVCKASPTCTVTVFPPQSLNIGPVCTSYRRTKTSTSTLNCKGCAVETRFFGPGPARQCTTTVTEPFYTSVTEVCTPTGK